MQQVLNGGPFCGWQKTKDPQNKWLINWYDKENSKWKKKLIKQDKANNRKKDNSFFIGN